MFNDILKVTYEFFYQIRDNYKIYSLIIIMIARNLTSVRCGLFKMLKTSHPTMFLHFHKSFHYEGTPNTTDGIYDGTIIVVVA
jgi:hypothetical protein